MTRRPSATHAPAEPRRTQQERLFDTRGLSLELAAPLSPEDMTVQPMDDASPTKWHLAHVTWFFETFILAKHLPGYKAFDPDFNYCFNSYYESQGPRQPRPKRGVLTRPSSERVLAYRAHVDDALAKLLAQGRLPELRDHPAHRGRHQSRAAASGAVAHRHPRAVCRQSAAAGLSRPAPAGEPVRARAAALDRLSRRHPPGRPRRPGLRLGQRDARATMR